MQGGYERYPMRPSPDPKQVGQQLMGMRHDPEEMGEDMAQMRMEGPQDEELTPQSSAPVPSATSAINAGYMSQSGTPSGLLAQIGDALQRVENGNGPILTPERQITAPNRMEQLLALGMSPEEAQLMMQTGGA